MNLTERFTLLKDALQQRILIIDGAMGTMLQRQLLQEDDFRGKQFRDHPRPLAGNHDLLCLTHPDAVRSVHNAYLAAGADVLETNSFNCHPVAQDDYGLSTHVEEMSRAAASVARQAADVWTGRTPEKPRFVAGVLGPTNRTASLSPDVEDPAARAVDFDTLAAGYLIAARGLIAGGADFILVETVFDTLNAKAALYAVEELGDELGREIPVAISVTIPDMSGRTLSGQTLEAFLISILHARGLFSVGLNCALGPEEMSRHVKELSRLCPVGVSAHPNAGLPDAFGGYSLSADDFAEQTARWADKGWLNLVGGCCGTTPEHIEALTRAVASFSPRVPAPRPCRLALSGLEPLVHTTETGFLQVGERCNVAGSRKFLRLIKTGDWSGALEIARGMVDDGANLLDVNMDDGLLDGVGSMTHFLRHLAAEPDVSRIPVMVDSSRFEVLVAGLKNIQGRGVVNSLSLKDGEDEFIRRARLVRRLGAAVLVMAFDEQGQAETVERRLSILGRAHDLLLHQAGFRSEEILFDPNIYAIGTGLPEHDRYAADYIETVRRLKTLYPAVTLSGGVSNLSFSFRGNEPFRQVMHTVFLHHAIRAGLDMGIVHPGQLAVYDGVDPQLRLVLEEAMLGRGEDPAAKLLELAELCVGDVAPEKKSPDAWRNLPVSERLAHALIHGLETHVETDVDEALAESKEPLHVIEGPLMAGMDRVGDLFGAGKMFLPQVVKSARVMKRAVARVLPHLPAAAAGDDSGAGRIVLATVRGDVHDIGKNIVSVVLSCNRFRVHDLGVMVPLETILAEAERLQADAVGLSGLITPSLDEMVRVAAAMKERGMKIPLLLGGATTSKLHAAVRVAPEYPGTVVHVRDASRAVPVLSGLLHPDRGEGIAREIQDEYDQLRSQYRERSVPLVALNAAREQKLTLTEPSPTPLQPGCHYFADWPLAELVDLIDWRFFLSAWEFRGPMEQVLADPVKGEAARKTLADGKAMLEEIIAGKWLRASGVAAILPARSSGDDIEILDEPGGTIRAVVPCLRQQLEKSSFPEKLSLADFLCPAEAGQDWLGAFAVTAGLGARERVEAFREAGDDYSAIMLELLADRLAEAFAEALHRHVRKDLWGFAANEGDVSSDELFAGHYQGIRPAPGYPACPDHAEKALIFDLLDAGRITMQLTETWAMTPGASVAGWIFAAPEARYFNVLKIGDDQLRDWARRAGLSAGEARKRLGTLL